MISKEQFADEFADLAYEAGITDTCGIDFPRYMAERHERDPRAYAEVDPWDLYFAFAPQVLALDWAHRRGLLMHELGHVLCRDLPGGGTEDDADRAALEAFGEVIVYDTRWPGKGLQCVRCSGRRNPAEPAVFYHVVAGGDWDGRDLVPLAEREEDPEFTFAQRWPEGGGLSEYHAYMVHLWDRLKDAQDFAEDYGGQILVIDPSELDDDPRFDTLESGLHHWTVRRVPARAITPYYPQQNPVDLSDVPQVIHNRIHDAIDRAADAGADRDTLEYVGAGMEGIVFRDGDVAYKVRNRHKGSGEPKTGRAARKTLYNEAMALKELSAAGAPVPRFIAYHPGIDVIVREHVEGRPGGWGTRGLRDAYAEIEAALDAADFTSGEFKENSFIVTPSGPVMVDIGFVQPKGQRSLDEVRRQMRALDEDSNLWWLRTEIRFLLSDGDIEPDEAERYADALGTMFGEDKVRDLRGSIRLARQ